MIQEQFDLVQRKEEILPFWAKKQEDFEEKVEMET